MKVFVLLISFLLLASCAGTSPRFTNSDGSYSSGNSSKTGVEQSRKHSPRSVEVDGIRIKRRDLSGMASWYGSALNGKKTASGEKFDMNSLTAAHNTIPFNTIVEVTDRESGKSVKVRINDRGPSAHNRVIDLSRKAAEKLGMIEKGVAEVDLTIIK